MVIGSENSRPAIFCSGTIPAVALMQNRNTDVNPRIESTYLVIFFILLFLFFGVYLSFRHSSVFKKYSNDLLVCGTETELDIHNP